ncbi:hypothetical protein AB9K26_06830 [Psychroserpens sp. XS_ASV72]|uniref:hypothetical protein n=1 Tax=Psychroserpens sp. XS_ASV72 TaxID=3241293 RepID=UPI003516E085
MKKIGIIGGSGYIESDIISTFLEKQYDVKISTSDITKKVNYQHLMDLKNSDNLYVCELDTSSKTDLSNFTKDCDFVVFIDPSDIK